MAVTIVYPGASPETVEREVVEPIEDALFSISGIDGKQTTASATDGPARLRTCPMDGAPPAVAARPCRSPRRRRRDGPAVGHAMHCRDCGAELLGLDPTTCRSCGARLLPLPALPGDDFGPGTADGGVVFRAVILVAGLGAALALGAAVVSAAA